MNTPAAALTWEIWRRHKNRLSVMAFLLITFALFYPKLCSVMGLDLNSPNALDTIATTASERFKDSSDMARIGQVITLLLLLLGPVGCMVASLLYVIWMFTFAQLDARKGFGLPSRLFTLPISTSFLASWLIGLGALVLFLVYAGWIFVIRLPHIDVFEGYPNFLAWLALLVVAQAIMWALDAFQLTRVLLLSAVAAGFGFLTGPALRDYPLLANHQQLVLVGSLAIGGALAFVGLDKIRHGAWQQWPWKLALPIAFRSAGISSLSVSSSSSAPAPFRSPSHAQFWFEWRHFGGSLLFVAGLSGTALLIMTVVALRVGTLSEGDTAGLTLVLLGVPLFVHFLHGIVPRGVPAFAATRPLTTGEVVMARLKTAGLSAVLCWVLTFALLALVPLLGGLRPMLDQFPLHVESPRFWPVLILAALGLVFLTWRFVPADLWLVCAPKTWPAKIAVGKVYAVFALGCLLSFLGRDTRYEAALINVLSVLFALLVVLKLFLAQRAFRACAQRRLLTQAAIFKYLGVWTALVGGFLVPTVILFHSENWILPAALGIVLLVPLARIGFSPIALSRMRHG